MGDLVSWLMSFIFLLLLLGILCHQIVCLTDLEFDYVNPFDSASQINMFIVPEFLTQGALCFTYLVTGLWFMFLMCLPNLCYNVRLYKERQHLIDVTEIFNQLRWAKRQRLFKLFYVLFLIILSLFWIIWSFDRQ